MPPCTGAAEGLRGCWPHGPMAHGPILSATSSHCVLGTSRAAQMCFGVRFELVCSLFAMVLRIRPVGDSLFSAAPSPSAGDWAEDKNSLSRHEHFHPQMSKSAFNRPQTLGEGSRSDKPLRNGNRSFREVVWGQNQSECSDTNRCLLEPGSR